MSMARGLQAISQASIAWSEREHTELQAQWEKEDIEHRRKEVSWRQQDLAYREVEKDWRKVDNKRRRVEEKTAQVALLARLSALMGGFQVAMFINQGLPSTGDTYPAPQGGSEEEGASVWDGNILLSQPIITIWSVVCASVIVLNFTVMVMSSLIQLSIVQATGDEGDSRLDFQPLNKQWNSTVKPGTGGPDGIIVNEEQFKLMWEGKFDKRFRLLMTLFSYGIPLYFLSLGIGAMIKFYMSPVAAWLAFAVTLLFIGVWLKYHLSHMAYLTWRPPAATSQQQQQQRGRGRPRGEGERSEAVQAKWAPSVRGVIKGVRDFASRRRLRGSSNSTGHGPQSVGGIAEVVRGDPDQGSVHAKGGTAPGSQG